MACARFLLALLVPTLVASSAHSEARANVADEVKTSRRALDSIVGPIKNPTKEHQSQMKSLLAEASDHVRYGGPEEEKMRRAHELIELHNGFVTDMIKEYRPSAMARYVEKVTFIKNMFEPADEGRRLATGDCFASYGAEWGCVMSSCWCDRMFYDSSQGPDTSSGCDDSSEYSAYACDVSMLQTECKISNDANCLGSSQDDWEINFFTNGTSSSISGNVDVQQVENDDQSSELELYPPAEGCGGNGVYAGSALSWSNICCGSLETCSYTDSTCSTDPFMCQPFPANLFLDDMETGTASPTGMPTYSTCDNVGLGTNAKWSGETGYKDATFSQFDDVYPTDDTACPNFEYPTGTASASVVDLEASAPRNAALALGSLVLALGVSFGLLA